MKWQGIHNGACMESQGIPDSRSQGIHDDAYMEVQGIHEA
jgi:hypothetical protein